MFGYETFCFGMFRAFSGSCGIMVDSQATIEEEPSLRRTPRELKIITPLITTHEPPSTASLSFKVSFKGSREGGSFMGSRRIRGLAFRG